MKTNELITNNFEEITSNEMKEINGGMFGWINIVAEFCTHGIHIGGSETQQLFV